MILKAGDGGACNKLDHALQIGRAPARRLQCCYTEADVKPMADKQLPTWQIHALDTRLPIA